MPVGKLKKKDAEETEWAIEIKGFRVTLPALVVILITVGLFGILSINLGYDKKRGGFYWKPLDIKVDVEIDEAKQ